MEWRDVRKGPRRLPGSESEMMPPCLPSTAEFQKRERRGYLGLNLRFMTSARSTVAESVTQQVRQGDGLWEGTWGVRTEAVPGIRGSLSPEHRLEGGAPSRLLRAGHPAVL